MTTMTYRAWVVPSVLIAAFVFAACDFKDELLEPQQPGTIGPEAVSDPIGADALVVGALQSFQNSTGGGTTMWSAGGTLARSGNSRFVAVPLPVQTSPLARTF